MRILVPLLAALLAAPSFAQSDVDVKDGIATQFTRSKGASLLGQTVHWHVPARAFNVPRKQRGGMALFVSSGIGILADAASNGVEEVRRRGGEACVRGRVIEVPPKEREPGDPAFAIVVYDLSHRKHK
jgi:hypothetical protein